MSISIKPLPQSSLTSSSAVNSLILPSVFFLLNYCILYCCNCAIILPRKYEKNSALFCVIQLLVFSLDMLNDSFDLGLARLVWEHMFKGVLHGYWSSLLPALYARKNLTN